MLLALVVPDEVLVPPAAKTPPEKLLPPAFGIRFERTPLDAYSADCEETSKTSSWTDISSVSIPMPPTNSFREPSCIPLLMPSTWGWASAPSEPWSLAPRL